MPTDPKPSATDRIRSAGVIVGPLVFISAWAVSGAVTDGYSPIRDHISDLAAVDAPTRPLMNAAFGTFGIAVAVAASPLRRLIGTPGAVLFGANALASFGIALAPLGRSVEGDRLHAVVAGLGYLVLAATAPAAAPALAKRSRPLAVASVGVGLATLASMVASFVGPASTAGFWQRAGITTTDTWLITIGLLAVAGYGTRTEPVIPPTR
ncbi:MAG: DUF998 domain-containing protein [Chloroflexi bacterium]|nr:DUF998 domain-containing protein [Chloroflexota bacterium]